MRVLISLCLLFVFNNSHSQTSSKKLGWLFYWSDKAIFLENHFRNCKKNNINTFFKANYYDSGLLVNYIPEALYFKSVAKKYLVENFSIEVTGEDAFDKRKEDTICILPVVGKLRPNNLGISGLSKIVKLSFWVNSKEIKIDYCFEQEYDVLNVELLRKRDRQRLKRVKKYVVYPPH